MPRAPEPERTPNTTIDAPFPPSAAHVYYKNCSEVRAAGAAPIRAGQPGYGRHLDKEGDGIACE
ncbi:excalibur calcium-binding domain-containing protein [Nocardia cyriacigeorgica]|uniref:excalibur calcium-binding domain-containing protein n=1 Tax=Nocardia cyriacigeorgica TaxID=135487 RepID=UPI0024590F83|nr:excalibur calcium-binding domain-containing protein [Nocardia cyriacigeorgica]